MSLDQKSLCGYHGHFRFISQGSSWSEVHGKMTRQHSPQPSHVPHAINIWSMMNDQTFVLFVCFIFYFSFFFSWCIFYSSIWLKKLKSINKLLPVKLIPAKMSCQHLLPSKTITCLICKTTCKLKDVLNFNTSQCRTLIFSVSNTHPPLTPKP